MSALDWLTHDKLQEMLRRQEEIQTNLDRGLPVARTDALWLSHVCGKLLFARVADVIELAGDGERQAQEAARNLMAMRTRRLLPGTP